MTNTQTGQATEPHLNQSPMRTDPSPPRAPEEVDR